MKSVTRSAPFKTGFSIRLYVSIFLLISILLSFVQLRQIALARTKTYNDRIENIKNNVSLVNTFFDNSLSQCQNVLMSFSTRKDISSLSTNDIINILYQNEKQSVYQDAYYLEREDSRVLCSREVLYTKYGNPVVLQLIQKAKQHKGIMCTSEVYYSKIQGYNCISSAITFSSINITVVVEFNLRYLYDYLDRVIGNNKYLDFFVTDSRNRIVIVERSLVNKLSAKRKADIRKKYSAILDTVKTINTLFETKKVEDCYVLTSNNNIPKWKISIISDKQLLSDGMENVYASYAFTTVIWIILFGLILFFLIFFITKRLRAFAKYMDTVDDYDSLKELPIRTYRNEIDRLISSYNRLIRQIKALIQKVRETEEKKKQYEVRMLQSQIGPHFLHNTLICVTSLLGQKRYGEAKASLTQLNSLLSYSFDRKEAFVTIHDEVDELLAYIKIAKMRFGESFTVRIEIPVTLGDCLLPKLTLQPLVENAIYHGLLPKKAEGKALVVRAFQEDEDVMVQIYDNGIGMSKAMCQQVLNQKINREKDRLSSIGIANVNERLKLIYGSRYGIQILSVEGKGTTMELRLKRVKS